MSSQLKKVNFYLRLIVVFVLSVATQKLSAQILADDFQDGDFTSNPIWEGNTSEFIVNSDDQLQLNDDEASLAYLSVPVGESLASDTEWRFYIKQSFSGSDNNNSRIYLMSSMPGVSYSGTGGASVNGYYLQLGEGGSNDAIRLMKNDADGTISEIAVGTLGFISSSFEITVKVIRSSTGDWQIWVDENAGEEYTLQASGTDNAYNFLNYFGWVCKYTSSNADKFFLDDLYVGEPIVDTEPPMLNALTVNSSTELVLEFSEPLDQTSAETLLNYSASGGIGSPSSSVFTAPNTVTLVFETEFISEQELTLSISGVSDVEGNEVSLIEEPFTYFQISEPQPGDIIINEIFADPSPAVGLPDTEWIELHNTSENAYDLSLLELYNTTTLNEIESYILPSGGYVVVSDAAGVSELQSFGQTAAASSFSALSNSGDSLTLLYNGTIIDLVVYEDDWYQDTDKDDGGWSLERINPLAVCSSSQNWVASNSAIGGTPGAENSVLDETPDTSAPEVISAALVNETLIFLQANELLNEVINVSDFSITNGYLITSVELTSSANGVLIHLEEPAEVGVPFTVSVLNLVDCEGNEFNGTDDWEIASGFPAEAGDVIITEIMADPSPQVGLPEVEYVEIYNTTDLFIDISDADFSGATFMQPVILAPGEYKVIMSEDDIVGSFIFSEAAGMTGWSSTFLTNSGKELILSTANGVIDEVSYTSEWYKDSDKDDGGWSLELINPTHPCSDDANWRASEAVFGGTPALQNSVFSTAEDLQAPEIILAYAQTAQSVVLVFDEPIDEASFTNSLISLNGESYSSIATQTLRSILVEFQEGLSPNEEYTLSVSEIQDCWGNSMSVQEVIIGLPEPADVGDLIINEVLSNPRGTASDYVEIYNHSDKIIDLMNWQLATRDEGEVSGQKIISETARPIFPGTYVLLSESIENVVENYPNSVVSNFLIMDIPSYSNDEGDVVLVMPNEEISDEFSYSSDYHFGLLDDNDGVSLERISFDVETQNSDNWSSAAESENYGSPGYKNSQSQIIVGSEGELTVWPEVFSPGGSGDVNNLEISFAFGDTSRSASVTVYSKDGVKMRDLKTNSLIGSKGTFFWDGMDNQGNAVPTGIYVIYFEVFNLDGEVKGYKVPCTVAYR